MDFITFYLRENSVYVQKGYWMLSKANVYTEKLARIQRGSDIGGKGNYFGYVLEKIEDEIYAKLFLIKL